MSWNKGKGERLAWLRQHASYAGEDCLLWQWTRNWCGYGLLGVNGKSVQAHRIMCELVRGPAPTPKHEAAHSCGRGHEGCVHPKHLSWKTRAENRKDRQTHGTAKWGAARRGRRVILTPEDVAEIRKLLAVTPINAIAARFDVTQTTIRQIRDGVTWRSDAKHRPLSPNEVIEVRKGLAAGMSPLQVSTQLGIHRNSVYRIRKGLTYTHVGRD